MTKSAMIRARIDPTLKEEVDQILQELGLSTTQALTLFYQQIRLNKGIPFAVRLPSEATEQTYSDSESSQNETQQDESTTLASRPYVSFPVDPRRPIMMQNVRAFKAMHAKLVQDYLGHHVAIYNGQLIDHDQDPVLLLQRIRQQYPNQVVLRRKVEMVPERALRIRHPRIEKLV